MRFLFWNVGVPQRSNQLGMASPQLIEQIARLAGDEKPDVLTLIEFGDPDARLPGNRSTRQQELRELLRGRTGVRYWFHPTNAKGIAHFTVRFRGRFRPLRIPPHRQEKRYDMRWVAGGHRDYLADRSSKETDP